MPVSKDSTSPSCKPITTSQSAPDILTKHQDYEIFLASAKSLRKQNEILVTLMEKYSRNSGAGEPSHELQRQLDTSFQQVRKELKLGKAYLTLYLERCTSGIQDTESLSTRYSAEVG